MNKLNILNRSKQCIHPESSSLQWMFFEVNSLAWYSSHAGIATCAPWSSWRRCGDESICWGEVSHQDSSRVRLESRLELAWSWTYRPFVGMVLACSWRVLLKWETLLPETLRSPDDLVFCFMDNKCVNGRLSRGNTVAGISHDLSNISMILHDLGWGNLAWPLPRVSLCLTTTCIDRCSLAMSCSHKTSRFNLYNRGRVRTAPRLLAHYATHQNPTSLRPIFVQSSSNLRNSAHGEVLHFFLGFTHSCLRKSY